MSIHSAQCQCYKTLLLTSSCQILGRILRVFLQRSDQFQFGNQGHFLSIYRSTVFFIPPSSKLDHRQTHLRLQQNQLTSVPTSSDLDDWLKGTNIDLEHRTSGKGEIKFYRNRKRERTERGKQDITVLLSFNVRLHRSTSGVLLCLSFQFLLSPLFSLLLSSSLWYSVVLFQHCFFLVVPHTGSH